MDLPAYEDLSVSTFLPVNFVRCLCSQSSDCNRLFLWKADILGSDVLSLSGCQSVNYKRTRHIASTEHLLTFRVRTMLSYRELKASLLVGWLVGWLVGCLAAWLPGRLAAWPAGWLVGWLEFNVVFQHK